MTSKPASRREPAIALASLTGFSSGEFLYDELPMTRATRDSGGAAGAAAASAQRSARQAARPLKIRRPKASPPETRELCAGMEGHSREGGNPVRDCATFSSAKSA